MNKRALTFIAVALAALGVNSIQAGKGNGPDKGANFGALFYDGQTVGTVATPTSTPGKGVDAIYVVSNGAEGQLGVTSVAPGDQNYHGGRWAVHVVTWVGGGATPLFTSSGQILQAYEDGDLEMVRMPEADFVCPVQKNGPRN